MATNVTRITNTGNLLVNGTFDEFTGAPVINSNTYVWLDAAQTASYPGTGTSWTSLTSQANVATLYNGTAFSTTKGGYFTFDGVDDYVQITPPLNIGTCTVATVEVWANIKSISGMVYGFTSYDLYMSGGAMGFNTGNSDIYGLTSANISSLGLVGNWKHYCYVMYNNVSAGGTTYNNNKIYVNGVSQPLQQATGNISASVRSMAGNIIIGGWTNNVAQYKPSMDSSVFKVYNRELTQAEVLQNYNALAGRYGLAANTTGTALQTTTSSTVLAEQFDEVTYNTTSPTIKNLFTYTEQFDNVAWGKQSSLTVTANATTAPDGSLTADYLYNGAASTGYLGQALNIVSGTTYCHSFYAKANTASSVVILLYGTRFNSGSTNIGITFNLSNGTTSVTPGGVAPAYYGITSVGNGWYRCYIAQTATTTATGGSDQPIRLVDAVLNNGIYAWGYQVEVGTSPTIYQPIAAANTLVSTGMAQRVDSGGNMYVSNIFNEVDGLIVTNGLLLYVNAAPGIYPGTGTQWTDLSPYNNNTTLTNSPTYSSTTGGGSFNFNGTTQYSAANTALLNTTYTGKTVFAVVRMDAAAWTSGVAAYRAIFGNAGAVANRNFNFYVYHDASNLYHFHYSTSGSSPLSGSLAITPGTWFIAAVTQDATTTTFYLNGTSVYSASGQTLAQYANGGQEAVAKADNYWAGDIAVCAVYSRALSAAEILTNYNAFASRVGL